MKSTVSQTGTAAPTRQLTLFDTSCIIVGIIIGAGIYETTPDIAQNVASPAALIGVWLLGGLIALTGALCYAELTTTYPLEGGDYVFLSRAYGRKVGFLFAWAEYWIIRPGNVGMMAFVFARFASDLYPLNISPRSQRFDFLVYACAAIGLLTVMNLFGVRTGKVTQNTLTTVKVLGLIVIITVGLLIVPAQPTPESLGENGQPVAVQEVLSGDQSAPPSQSNFKLALILILFTYGGWNEISYVAAEVREPNKNLFRALVAGILTITAIYVAVNLAFVSALGLRGTGASRAVAADILRVPFGDSAGRLMSLLVCVSCLGAINGMLFTGSRVFYAAGKDHPMIGWLGQWNRRFDTPLRSLFVQLAVTVCLVVGFGWYEQGFDRLFHFTAPVFWFFASLVALSLFVFRFKEPSANRPHRVLLYPATPILFLLACLFLFYASFTYAWSQRSMEAHWTIGILIVGVICSVMTND